MEGPLLLAALLSLSRAGRQAGGDLSAFVEAGGPSGAEFCVGSVVSVPVSCQGQLWLEGATLCCERAARGLRRRCGTDRI